jgi:hypothetical protein
MADALTRQLDAAPPATNSADNPDFRYVIGSKLDASYAGGTSLFAHAHTLEDHVHSTQLVRPDLANAVTVTGHANAWTYGVLSGDIIPAAGPGSMASPFDIHGIAINTISANDQYQLALVKTVGGVDTVIMEVSFVRESPQLTSMHIPVQTPLMAAWTQIRAKLASAGGGGDTCGIKVRLHVY